MHTHPPSLQNEPLACPEFPAPHQRKRAGFSLIEVTLAVAIIAFAFVSLIGLLPAGLGVFQQTMDSTNEMRISTVLSSMVQATDYDKLTSSFGENVYYFDVDGGFLDSEKNPQAAYKDQRIYSARVIFDDQFIKPSGVHFKREDEGMKCLVVIGRYNGTVNEFLTNLTTASQAMELPKGHKIRILPMMITKTDGQ